MTVFVEGEEESGSPSLGRLLAAHRDALAADVIVIADSDNWSTDVQSRPYLTDGMCGPGTTYACPGPGTPIFKPHSIHITPEGKIIVPQGVKLPPLPGHD